MEDNTHQFKLLKITQETEDVISFVFAPDDNKAFTWVAGQYLDWQLPHANADERGERRWFSIASAPSEGFVMLSCRFSADGSSLKKRLQSLQTGDVITAKGPEGQFTLPVARRKTILIAGGIGITPFRAILQDLASRKLINNIELIHGNRSPENVPFEKEIKSLARENEDFKVHYSFSPDIINADSIREIIGDLLGVDFMISGLEKMVESIRDSLLDAGVNVDAIRIDDFGGYDWHLNKPVY